MRSPAVAPVHVPRTTLLAIDCRHPRLAARALRLSLDQCRFERAKLLTDDATKITAFIAAQDDATLYGKGILFHRLYPSVSN